MALGKVFGPSLLWWRLLRVAADATAAVLVCVLVRDAPAALGAPGMGGRRGHRRPADEREPHRARARVRPRRRLRSRRPPAGRGLGAAPIGARPAPRSGAPTCDAALAAAAASRCARAGPRPAGADLRPGRVALAARPRLPAVAAAGLLVLYAPFLVAAGPGAVWDALVVQATRDGEWWRLPFPASAAATRRTS